jgi:hypothetical protein
MVTSAVNFIRVQGFDSYLLLLVLTFVFSWEPLATSSGSGLILCNLAELIWVIHSLLGFTTSKWNGMGAGVSPYSGDVFLPQTLGSCTKPCLVIGSHHGGTCCQGPMGVPNRACPVHYATSRRSFHERSPPGRTIEQVAG